MDLALWSWRSIWPMARSRFCLTFEMEPAFFAPIKVKIIVSDDTKAITVKIVSTTSISIKLNPPTGVVDLLLFVFISSW